MHDSKVIQGIAGVVTLAAVAVVVLTRPEFWPPRVNPEPHEAAGWTMAREASRLLQPGGQLLVITRDTAEFKNPAVDIQRAAFERELRRTRTHVDSVRALQVDPLRPVEVPPGDFLEWIRQAPKGSVIVSLMGPPRLSPVQQSQLREIKPRIVAFCSGSLPDQIDLRTLFERGLLHSAIVSRNNPLSSPAKPKGRQGWFDRHFVMVTAENVGGAPWRSESPATSR